MSWIALSLVSVGGAIAILNFYLSFLAAPLHRVRHGRPPARVASGFPLIGSASLLIGASIASSGAATVVALVLVVLDTGGPHWFVGTMIARYIGRRSGRG